MALKLYRRHRKECEAGLPVDEHTGQFEEGRRGWKKCACLIHASGKLAGHFNRRQTGKNDWGKAKAVATQWEAAGSWDGWPKPKPEPPAPAQASRRITIDDAIRVFLTLREGDEIAPATLRKYRTFAKQLLAFAESRGYVMLDQLTSADIDRFYGGLKLGPRAKAKRLGTLRSFFRFCANRKWLAENPVSSDLKPPLGANRAANKVPFTDPELERIIAACDALGAVTWINEQGPGEWTGDEVKDFIWTLTYTGLRISDVGLFDIKRLQGNEVFLRTKKNGGDVFVYIPDWLRDRLLQLAHGHVREAIDNLKRQGRVHEITNREDRLEAIAKAYAKRPENTLVVSPDNRSRQEINERIHREMQSSGRVEEQEYRHSVLVPRQEMTGADRQWAEQYKPGDIVRCTRGSNVVGVQSGEYVHVIGIDRERSLLMVERENGQQITYDPNRLHGVSVYREAERNFSAGDRVQFTAPYRDEHIANRELGTVQQIDAEGNLQVRLDSGHDLHFNIGEHPHLDYGYAVTSRSSQGATADRVLVHVDTEQASGLLVNSRLAYVAVSRGRFDAQIYTNDTQRLSEELSRDISKTCAMEIGHEVHGKESIQSLEGPAHRAQRESHYHGQGISMD